MAHSFSGHVGWTAPSAVAQLKVGTMKKEKSGGVIAAVEGRKEECCLTLVVL